MLRRKTISSLERCDLSLAAQGRENFRLGYLLSEGGDMKHCRTGRVLLWGVIAILACSRYSMSAGDCNQRDRENDEDHEKRDEKRDEGRDEKKDGQDCNQNGIPDECDVKPTTKLVLEQEISVGGRPISLLAGDFDGDSFLDLLVVTTRPDGLS